MNKKEVSFSPNCNAIIAGSGSAVPPGTLTNEDLTKIVDTSDEWITTRTGIKVRHIASEKETTATLAIEAAKKALAKAQLDPLDIDLIIVATVTPEMVFPSTACFVQDAIGAGNAWAFDLNAACSGFVYGMMIAQQFITTGRYNNVMVIGAETLSKITDYKDRQSCILFGDGAGAVIVQKSFDGPKGILYGCASADGSGWTSINCLAYGSRNPVSQPLEHPDMVFMNINGREVYQLAVRRLVEMVYDCAEKCNLTIDDIDHFIPHQMNARIIESVAKRLKLKDGSVFINIDKYGNTSAASIPIALDECLSTGRIKTGDVVLMAAFGGGLTWGASVIQF
ncbi:MAG: ketoacyl-ACP synthase III [Planctomycetes bacterium]|nr:ketoacyl-ACP synthase III [Planctomycetota bacterium]